MEDKLLVALAKVNSITDELKNIGEVQNELRRLNE